MVLLATVGWSLAGMFVRLVPGLNGWQINCWLLLIYGRNTPARFREIPLGAMISSAGFFALGSTMYVTALTFTSTANVSALSGESGRSAPLSRGVSEKCSTPFDMATSQISSLLHSARRLHQLQFACSRFPLVSHVPGLTSLLYRKPKCHDETFELFNATLLFGFRYRELALQLRRWQRHAVRLHAAL